MALSDLKVTATCPDCGTIQTTGDNIEVRSWYPTANITYSFLCPKCSKRACQPLSPITMTSLTVRGVRLIHSRVSSEPRDADRRLDRPPIDHNDIVALYADLESFEV